MRTMVLAGAVLALAFGAAASNAAERPTSIEVTPPYIKKDTGWLTIMVKVTNNTDEPIGHLRVKCAVTKPEGGLIEERNLEFSDLRPRIPEWDLVDFYSTKDLSLKYQCRTGGYN